MSDTDGVTNDEARRPHKEPRIDSLTRDWSEKSALDKYVSRVRRAAAQYRRECAISSPPTSAGHEARAFAELQAEQQRAMRDLVIHEYRRLVALRNAPHQEPTRRRQVSRPT
jgi:predicted DsbA family dithiol-disulfide isomerase